MSGIELGGLCPFGSEWQVKCEIGKGSYGSVYLIERMVGTETIRSAMKVIRLPASDDEPLQLQKRSGMTQAELKEYYDSVSESLIPEIQIMSKLRGDSHIVTYEDHKIVPRESGIGADFYIRMEYLQSLKDWLKSRTVTAGDVVRLGIELCEALETCSQFNIVHRDIKPANIFVAQNGSFKLGDFGISQCLDSHILPEDRNLGSLNYIAPEVKKSGHFDSRADIYGIGMVMYRLLNNDRLPFLPKAPSAYTTEQENRAIEKRLSGEKLPKPANAGDLLWEIIQKACAYQPDNRYKTAEEMRKALSAINKSAELTVVLQPHFSDKDKDTSKRTYSTGPNGTERRISSQTPTKKYPPTETEKLKIQKKQNKWRWIILPAIAVVLVVGLLVVFRPHGPETFYNSKLSVDYEIMGDALEIKIKGGNAPYHFELICKDFVVDKLDTPDDSLICDKLVPQQTYQAVITDAKGIKVELEDFILPLKTSSEKPLNVLSLLLYECDRQLLSTTDWFALSEKNRVKALLDNSITLKNVSMNLQNDCWHALITAKAIQNSTEPFNGLLVLRLSNGLTVSERIMFSVSKDRYSQVAISLDGLLESMYTTCGEWIQGQAWIELYIDGQYIIDEKLMIEIV